MHDSDMKPVRRGYWLAGIAAGAFLLTATPAAAETLQGALAKAYENNPTLTAARAGQRANDENVPIQRSQGLPSLGAQGDYSENLVKPGNSLSSPTRLIDAGGRLSALLRRALAGSGRGVVVEEGEDGVRPNHDEVM